MGNAIDKVIPGLYVGGFLGMFNNIIFLFQS